MLITKAVSYNDENISCEGYYANNETDNANKPAVLIFPDWSGKNPFACKKAEKLAELGYIGFVADVFGSGKTGKTKEEKSALIQPFMANRNLLKKRVLSALDAVKKCEGVDSQRIAAIGFCFGGLCALDLARTGTDLKAVVSFHGLLHPPRPSSTITHQSFYPRVTWL